MNYSLNRSSAVWILCFLPCRWASRYRCSRCTSWVPATILRKNRAKTGAVEEKSHNGSLTAPADRGTAFRTVWLIIISLQLTGLSKWFSSLPLPTSTDLWLMRFVFRLVVEHKLTNQWEWIHILSCKGALLQWSVFNIQINFEFSGWFC